ncbi:phage tail tube protein [Streptomyces sp. NPDC059853]|uniref:phage tail tube protein n=1 Tax=Streptomyces sp. NPDC059853 TaxID=3346973 RepID=UPI003656A427
MTTPTPAAETVTALARRYRLECNMGTADAPDWQLVPGVLEFKPAEEPTQEEVTTYDSEGWGEHAVTQLDWQIETKLAHRHHPETGEFNPVQVHLRKTARRFAAASYVHLRYFDRSGQPDAYEGRALVTWAPEGGDAKTTDQVAVTFKGSGPLLEIENPAEGAGLMAARVSTKKSTAAVSKEGD